MTFNRQPGLIVLSTLLILVVRVECISQQDSLALVSADWSDVQIAKGVFWKRHWFQGNLFNSNQNINILEIKKRSRNKIAVGYEEKVLKPTSEFGKSAGALAALNGTFFDIYKGGSVDLIKAASRVINDNRLTNGKRAVHQRAAITITNGKFEIARWDGSEKWEYNLAAEAIMDSGPVLIYNAKAEAIDSSSFSKTRHPRTAVALTRKKILFFTIDGRHTNAAGMSLYELQNVMRWLGVNKALNLDGGGSTTLWIHDQPNGGVVNYPCDLKTWDHQGERKVANVLLLMSSRK